MKINLAQSAGFCFGVKRALDIASETASSLAKVYMLGDIVHNEDVVKEIEKNGIKKIGTLHKGKGRILLIRAHGEPKKTIQKAMLLGYKIIDATCPMVKEIHKIAMDCEQKGYKIIIIGDKLHDEVRGIAGQLKNKAIIIDDIESLPLESLRKIDKACIVIQSTQKLETALKINKAVKRYVKNLKFFNTICRPTRIKQEEIKKMPLENDCMIIIGSKNSANTKRLYEISKSLNKHTYWISSVKEIREDWFKEIKSVGVTAGASTPNQITREVINYLSCL